VPNVEIRLFTSQLFVDGELRGAVTDEVVRYVTAAEMLAALRDDFNRNRIPSSVLKQALGIHNLSTPKAALRDLLRHVAHVNIDIGANQSWLDLSGFDTDLRRLHAGETTLAELNIDPNNITGTNFINATLKTGPSGPRRAWINEFTTWLDGLTNGTSRVARSDPFAPILNGRLREIAWRDLGVTPAYDTKAADDERWSPKITCPWDERVQRALQDWLSSADPVVRLVLLSGMSQAGKTRTAYDALMTCAGDAWIIAPRTAEQATQVLARTDDLATLGDPSRPLIVWLDDVEDFIRATGGVTAAALAALEGVPRQVIVVATKGGRGAQQIPDNERELVTSELQTITDRAHHFELLDDKPPADAIAHVPAYGDEQERIARLGFVAMTGAQRLLDKLATGRHPGDPHTDHAGQRVARTVLAWHHVGLYDPMPEHALRIAARQLQHLTDDQIDDGIKWATRPLVGDLALISRRWLPNDTWSYRADEAVVVRTTP